MKCEETQENELTTDTAGKSFKSSNLSKRFACSVCPLSYTHGTNLKYHVRRNHFNLTAQVFMRERRKINEVWLERVMNSDSLVEITKAGPNKYVMRKASKDAECEELGESVGSLDMSPLFPGVCKIRKKNINCGLCHRIFETLKYVTHVEEEHDDVIV